MCNTGFPFSCPTCSKPLTYIHSEGELHFYTCSPAWLRAPTARPGAGG